MSAHIFRMSSERVARCLVNFRNNVDSADQWKRAVSIMSAMNPMEVALTWIELVSKSSKSASESDKLLNVHVYRLLFDQLLKECGLGPDADMRDEFRAIQLENSELRKHHTATGTAVDVRDELKALTAQLAELKHDSAKLNQTVDAIAARQADLKSEASDRTACFNDIKGMISDTTNTVQQTYIRIQKLAEDNHAEQLDFAGEMANALSILGAKIMTLPKPTDGV